MKYWTEAGINRLAGEIEALRALICAEREAKLKVEVHRHPSQESPSDMLLWGTLLSQKQALFESVVPVKVTQSKKGQVGQEIGIEHLDAQIQVKRGRNELFILGGVGEDDSSASPRVISCTSAIGTAVVNTEVGDTVDIRWSDGLETEAIVRSIAIPKSGKTVAKETVSS